MTLYRSMGAEHEGKGFEVVLEGEWNINQEVVGAYQWTFEQWEKE